MKRCARSHEHEQSIFKSGLYTLLQTVARRKRLTSNSNLHVTSEAPVKNILGICLFTCMQLAPTLMHTHHKGYQELPKLHRYATTPHLNRLHFRKQLLLDQHLAVRTPQGRMYLKNSPPSYAHAFPFNERYDSPISRLDRVRIEPSSIQNDVSGTLFFSPSFYSYVVIHHTIRLHHVLHHRIP